MTDINKIIGEVKVLEKSQKEAELDLSKFYGQLEQEIKRLKADHNLDNIDQANKELDKLQRRLATIDIKIIEKYEALKESYDVPT
jgi:chromosome segregation ATPase